MLDRPRRATLIALVALLVLAAGARVAPPSAAETAPVKAGDLAIDTPWLRATPNGARVAGGYVVVTNAGTQADRLVGAAIPGAARGEVHSMSMEGGVMRMAPVEGGLAIAPGGSVTLRPGGNHLMFLGLTEGLTAGTTVAGTLVFERAGTVPVTFRVAPVGATSPAGSSATEAGAPHHH